MDKHKSVRRTCVARSQTDPGAGPVLTEHETDRLAMELLSQLNGLNLADARCVLQRAEGWLLSTHRLDTANPAFQRVIEELEALRDA